MRTLHLSSAESVVLFVLLLEELVRFVRVPVREIGVVVQDRADEVPMRVVHSDVVYFCITREFSDDERRQKRGREDGPRTGWTRYGSYWRARISLW